MGWLTVFGLPIVGQNRQLTPEQRAAIDKFVKAEMARERIPGVEIGIYSDGRALLEEGYGLANVELGVPVKPEMVFQSGSVGKQFTATAIMMLVEQGKVGLDDSVLKYFPEGPASWKTIQIKNLLSHTSGLAEYENDERTKTGGEFDLRMDFTEDELAHKIAKLPLDFQPGTDWSYRNTNYVLLGILIHRVTGSFYGDYLRDHIFKPIGMGSTHVMSDRDITPGRVAGYEIEAGELKNQNFVSRTFNSTADGTLYFNVVDLEKWDGALYGTQLLSRASLEKMFTPFVLNDGKPNESGYGFAWVSHKFNEHRVVEHNGAWQGFSTLISRYLDDKLTVVVLANLDAGHTRPAQIERVVAGLVEPALMPKTHEPIADTKPEIATTVRALTKQTLSGKDASSFYGKKAEYKFDAGDAGELRAKLPAQWETMPWQLVMRKETKDGITSRYRLGRVGDARSVDVQMDPAGKVVRWMVFADPDNR